MWWYSLLHDSATEQHIRKLKDVEATEKLYVHKLEAAMQPVSRCYLKMASRRSTPVQAKPRSHQRSTLY